MKIAGSLSRGGAISSQFDYAKSNAEEAPLEEPQTEEELWDNLAWLLERVVPVAEKAGVSRFMTKPFSNAEVLTAVRDLLAQASQG